MWPDRVSNPGPLTYESGALPTALHSPAIRNNYFLGSYFLALTRKINLISEFCTHSGCRGWGGAWDGERN